MLKEEQAYIVDGGEKLYLGITWGEYQRTPQEIEQERQRWLKSGHNYPTETQDDDIPQLEPQATPVEPSRELQMIRDNISYLGRQIMPLIKPKTNYKDIKDISV